eukprot:5755711-Pyramimonas_sp.AAC.1
MAFARSSGRWLGVQVHQGPGRGASVEARALQSGGGPDSHRSWSRRSRVLFATAHMIEYTHRDRYLNRMGSAADDLAEDEHLYLG